MASRKSSSFPAPPDAITPIFSPLDAAHAAADGERDEERLGDAMDGVERGAFSRIGRGDVEDHQLVRPLGLVAHRALDRIAGVADVREADPLDDAAVADVEAGDDALRDGVRRGHARTRLAEVDAPLQERLADHAIDADPSER